MTTTVPVGPLAVAGVGQRFGKRWVLRGCSFSLRPGSVTALIGPNGAGKSTLMAAAAGLLRPSEGEIFVFGDPITDSPAHPRLGYLAQDKPLYLRHTVRDMVALAGYLNDRWDSAHAADLIRQAGLNWAQRVATLSGGQRTRLALILVLARRPSVLLLDEPLADLDPLARQEVQQTLAAEVTGTGMTVLMSSHILSEVVDLCEDILIMGGGRIALAGVIDDVLADHLLIAGPGVAPADLDFLPEATIIAAQHAKRQTTLLARGTVGSLPRGWTSRQPDLEEIVVAYLRADRGVVPEET